MMLKQLKYQPEIAAGQKPEIQVNHFSQKGPTMRQACINWVAALPFREPERLRSIFAR